MRPWLYAGSRLLGRARYKSIASGIARANLVGYWPMDEAAGPTAIDVGGNYNGTYGGATVGAATAFPRGGTSPTFDGNDYVNIYSAGLNTAYPRTEGTVAIWAKQAAAQWADATGLYLVSHWATAAQNLNIIQSTSYLYLNYKDAGGTRTPFQPFMTTSAWIHLALSWSVTDNIVRGYLNGYPMDTPSVPGVIGWTEPLHSGITVFGAYRTTGQTGMIGALAHAGLWNKALTAAEILQLVNPVLSERGILYIGDSKSSGDAWLYYLPQTLNERGSYNYQSLTTTTGVPGGTAASVKATVLAYVASATKEAHVATINFGANDVVSLPAEATWKADMSAMIDAIRAKWPNCKIYIARPWRRSEAADCNTLAGWIDAIVAAYPSNVYVGMDERVWLEGGDDGATMSTDGIHYSAAGQTAAAAAWAAVIT